MNTKYFRNGLAGLALTILISAAPATAGAQQQAADRSAKGCPMGCSMTADRYAGKYADDYAAPAVQEIAVAKKAAWDAVHIADAPAKAFAD